MSRPLFFQEKSEIALFCSALSIQKGRFPKIGLLSSHTSKLPHTISSVNGSAKQYAKAVSLERFSEPCPQNSWLHACL